ncbi:diguanylate cyclase [Pseudoalteromonas sp.]|uniref:GGDEF domain-containing protein n=1 Tax=Pseudoalteromonas sp. TaxID=53249 RepID=UPI001BCCCB00|nr:diguanylate cyclase [Pseudoalteromonas sp.]
MKSKAKVNKHNWRNLINIDSVYSFDKQRQMFSLFTMIAISLVLITYLVIANHQVYAPMLTAALILVNLTIVGCIIYFIKTREIDAIALITSVIVFVMCLALVYTGGKQNTALYWLMFYPVVVFAILGVKLGGWLSSAMLLSSVVLLYGPDVGQVVYGEVEKTRFVAAFSLVLVFSFIGEYFRHRSHLAIADITLEQKQHAYTDQLTGAPNRRFITSHFLNLAASRPAHYLPLSILLIDLDKFKSLNDTYGHDFGDTVLIEFTKLLESQFPATALKARYGGEEFVVILPQLTTIEASILANRFRECVQQHVLLTDKQQHVSLTCSIGIAQANHVDDYNQALKQADDYLYQAKAQGRNKVICAHAQHTD